MTGTIVETTTIGAETDTALVVLTLDLAEGRRAYVFLAPPSVINAQDVRLSPGQEAVVKAVPGFRYDGRDAMLAREVQSAGQTLTLRDARGARHLGWRPGTGPRAAVSGPEALNLRHPARPVPAP